jgi:hypothetical protein
MKKKLIVFFGTILFALLLPAKVNAGNSTLEIKHNSFEGDTLVVDVYLDPSDTLINAVTADFTYPSTILSFESIDTSESLFDNFIEKKNGEEGKVLLSAYSLYGVNKAGVIASVTFKAIAPGKANLEFTDDVLVMEAYTATNTLETKLPATYNISSDITDLPETGTTETVVTASGIIALIAILMIILLAIAGFTMWGGIYLSLGKWKVSTEGGFEMGKKGKKAKGKRSQPKAGSPMAKKVKSKKQTRKKAKKKK